MAMHRDKAPDHWLALRLGAMGDVVLTTGVLEYWQRTRGFRFDVLTRAAFAPLLEGHPAVNRVVGLAPETLNGLRWLATARELARRYAGWGLVDLHGTLRSRLLAALWRGPVRRYPKLAWTRRFYLRTRSMTLNTRLFQTNVPQRYALALAQSPPAAAELRPRLQLRTEELRAACERLDAAPQLHPGTQRVALHPFTTHPGKAWPRERWRELVQILDAHGVDWFWIGRAPATQCLAPTLRGCDFVNRTTLRETAALIAAANVLVSADSGPMHLATAVATPVVALFGPTDQGWGFYPSGPHDVVLELDLDCRPCSLHGATRCHRQHRCLADISATMVYEQVAALLAPATDH